MAKYASIALVSLVLALIPHVAEAGTVTRVFDDTTVLAMDNFNVTLVVDTDESVPEEFYAFDDVLPSGWEDSVVDRGGLDTNETGHLKMINTSNASDTSYSYRVQAPDLLGEHSWSGIFMFEGMSSETYIAGDATLTVVTCEDGQTRDCGPSTVVGECKYGVSTCSEGAWGTCIGAVYPATEICDGLDNDCDGSSDEDWPTLGDACTAGVGECQGSGTIVCTGDTTVGCSATPGTPVDEQCPSNRIDNDCDGDDTEFNGDSNCDCHVDVNDLSLVGLHFGETSASPNWDPSADLISDNAVDIFDLVMVGVSFSKDYSDDPGCAA